MKDDPRPHPARLDDQMRGTTVTNFDDSLFEEQRAGGVDGEPKVGSTPSDVDGGTQGDHDWMNTFSTDRGAASGTGQHLDETDSSPWRSGYEPNGRIGGYAPADGGEQTVAMAPGEQAAFAEAEQLRRLEEEQLRAQEAQRHEDAARARAEERARRDRALGTVQRSDDSADANADRGLDLVRTTDRFAGSFGLFVVRLVTGLVFGVHGFQHLTNVAATTDFLARLSLPYADYLAWVLGVSEILAGVAFVFGFATRVAGVGAAMIAIAALVLVRWGNFNPFTDSGFSGEIELVLAAIGVLLAFVGPGGWSIDANWRRNRLRSKAGY